MATVIKNRQKSVWDYIPKNLAEILPPRLIMEIERLGSACAEIEEIRIRRDRRASLTLPRGNLLLDCIFSGEDMEQLLKEVSGYSLYAHSDTIKNGYLTLDGGVRVGIVGRAAVEDGRVIGVYDISAMCFRLPHKILNIGGAIKELLLSTDASRGILIYSPPGEGKTTLLRSVARMASSGIGARRVTVIDTRDELGFSLDEPSMCLDIMRGYPRALGIEIATRSMNSQLIICDEIGEISEAEAIISAQNCGVPFVASAHADSIEALLRRTAIRRLHKARVFEYYVGIRRQRDGVNDFEYDVTEYGEADRYY